MKEVTNRPEVREHHSKKMIEYYENNPEEREKSSKRFKEMEMTELLLKGNQLLIDAE